MTDPTPPQSPNPSAPPPPPSPLSRNVTRILNDASAGEAAAAEQLLPLVYQQLRAIAQLRMNGERKDHTLQATALVHEAYVKLVGGEVEGGAVQWSGRAAFFKAAAEAMRRILIDHARTKGRDKRGGGVERSGTSDQGERRQRAGRVPLSVVDLAAESDSEEILALDEAICRLEQEDAEVAAVVRLRFFAGLGGDDTASALGISPRQVDRHWAYARARLYQALQAGQR